MNQITPYQQAENAVIVKAQRQFQRDLGHTGQRYEDEPINYGSLLKTMISKQNTYNFFFTQAVDGTPIQANLQPAIRAYVVLSQGKPGTKISRLITVKTLAVHLARHCEHNHLPIAWNQLTEPILEQTERYYQTNYSQGYAGSAGAYNSQFATFLTLNNLCRRLDYYRSTPSQQKANLTKLADQKRALEKLPSQRSLYALAGLYNSATTTEDEQFMLNALAILFCTGLRISELISLPLDCEHKEAGRYGIRFYNQKAQSGHEKELLWLGKADGDRAQIAQQAIAQIKNLTAGPRERAKVLEANPGLVPIPGYGPNDRISTADLCKLLGGKTTDGIKHLRRKGKLTRQKSWRSNYYTIASIENYLKTRLSAQLWTRQFGDGTCQPLSQSLFVIYEDFLNTRNVPNPLLCRGITKNDIYRYICPTKISFTLFQRYDIREENGDFCRIHPHQFRHYIDTCLYKGGMSADMITIYRHRTSVTQTRQYIHLDDLWLNGLKDKLRNGIREGTMVGAATRTYNILPASERDRYLDGVLGNIHVNSFGYCVHDFSALPCPHSGRCVKGCTDFLCEAGNPEQHQAAIAGRAATKHALDYMHAQAEQTGRPIAPDWLEHYHQLITSYDRFIAVHEKANLSEEATKLFPNFIPTDAISVTTKEN